MTNGAHKSWIRSWTRHRQNFRYAFRWRKPRLVALLAWRLLEAVLLRKLRLRYVDVALDFTCNQHCQHCFARTYDHQDTRGRGALSSADYENLFREARELGAVSFSIQGGEPFALLEETKRAMRAMDAGRSLISVKSNGSLVTAEKLAELKELGLDIVTISLDSGVPEEHDAFRGMRGAWQKAAAAVRLCREAGVGVMLACTVSRQNAGSAGVEKLIEVAREWDVLLLFILAAPSGNWQGRHDLLMTEDQMEWLRGVLREHPHVRTDFEANWVKSGCGAMKEIIYVSQYGDVMSCPFIQVSFGNVKSESLAAIWQRGIRAPYFRDYAGKCLIGEDAGFIRQYSSAIASGGELPVSLDRFESFGEVEKHPNQES